MAAQIVAPLHRRRQFDFALAGQQRHPADLAQVHPHRVVEVRQTGIDGLVGSSTGIRDSERDRYA